MKRFSIFPFALALFVAPVTLASCGNNVDVSFYLRDSDVYKGTYQVGDPIDTEYFFYVSDATKVKITVSFTYEGIALTEEVKGHTYYPRSSGDYVFSCSAGNKTIRKSVRVEDAKPTLNIDDMPTVEVAGKFLYFEDIIAKIAPSYTPSSSSVEVNRVEFKPLATSIDDEPSYRLIEIASDGFQAKKPGNYRIYCSVKNGVKFETGIINVVVVRQNNDGNENVGKGVNGKYQSNHALIHGDNPSLFTLPKARYIEASYFALKDKFSLGDQVAVRFKGKNIPMIGFQMIPSAAGDFAPSTAQGSYLTFEYNGQDVWNLKSRSLLTGTNWKGSVYNESARRFEEFGRSYLDDDKFYYLSANLSENTIINGKHLHCISWAVYEVLDYGTANEHISAPLMDIYYSGWLDEYSLDEGNIVFYGSFYQDITFEVLTTNRSIGNNMVVYDGQKLSDGRVMLAPALKVASGNFANDIASSYVGYSGNYGAGNSVAFEFEGADIPDVCIFADDLSGPTGDGQGLYIGQGTNDPSLRGRTTFYAPYRLDCLKDPGHAYKEHGDHSQSEYATLGNNDRIYTAYQGYRVKLVDGKYVPEGEPSPFGRDALDKNKTHLYRVSIDNVTDNGNGTYDVSIGLTLYEKTVDGYKLIKYLPNTIKNYSGPISGNIIAYPEIQCPVLFPNINEYAKIEDFNAAYDKWQQSKLDRHVTTIRPYPVNGSPVDENVFLGKVEGNNISLDGLMSDEAADTEPAEDRYRLPYAGIADCLDVGDTLKVTYKGKNIPNVAILADSDRGQAVCGGQGFYIGTSFIIDSTAATQAKIGSQNSERFTPCGPYRWSNDYGHSGWDTKYRYAEQCLYKSGFGILEQDDDANYEYYITVESLVDGVLTLSYGIKNFTLGTIVNSRSNIAYNLASHLDTGDKLNLGNNVIFYGHGRHISFSYEIVKGE